MVYILEISPRLKHAGYYIGRCKEGRLKARLQEHLNGGGAKITAAALQAGCQIKLVAFFPKGSFDMERQLKNRKETPRIVERIKQGKLEGWVYNG